MKHIDLLSLVSKLLSVTSYRVKTARKNFPICPSYSANYFFEYRPV